MKKGLSLLGLPVISIKEGKEMGRVIDLLVAPQGLKLEFLLVGRQSQYIDLRLLAFSHVVGLGQYAVTVETEAQLQQIEAVPAVRDCLEASVDIMDKMVLSRSGNLEGMIADLFFDEKNGSIVRLEYKDLHNDMELQSIDSREIISLGQDVLFVKDRRQAHAKAAHQNLPATPPTAAQKRSGALMFKQKHRQFLMGKEVQKDIRDRHNQVIIPRGTVITGEVLDVAEGHDRFSELTQWAK